MSALPAAPSSIVMEVSWKTTAEGMETGKSSRLLIELPQTACK
jgi:hypothetical protein